MPAPTTPSLIHTSPLRLLSAPLLQISEAREVFRALGVFSVLRFILQLLLFLFGACLFHFGLCFFRLF